MYQSFQLGLLLIVGLAACNQDKTSDLSASLPRNNNQSVSAKHFPNGDLYIVESHQNGKLNGPVIGFFDNKRVSISGYYKKGKREGTWLFFSPDGRLRRSVEFKDDKATTSWNDSTLVGK